MFESGLLSCACFGDYGVERAVVDSNLSHHHASSSGFEEELLRTGILASYQSYGWSSLGALKSTEGFIISFLFATSGVSINSVL